MADGAAQRGSQPNWFNLFRAGIELLSGGYCIIMQFNTTRDSIFGLMQAGTQVPAQMNTQQLLNFLSGNATKLNIIAFTVALVVQVVFWWFALPDTRKGHHPKLRKVVAAILLVLEIASDIVYASSTQTVLNGDIIRVFFSGWSWLGIILFALCISFGSSFVFLDGIRVLGNVIEGQPD